MHLKFTAKKIKTRKS